MANSSSLSADEYDEMWSYLDDFIRYNPGARHRRRKVFHILESLSLNTVLDVGCGNGELIQTIHEVYGDSVTLTGADLSSSVTEQNTARYPYAKFHTLNVQQEFLDQQFDLVICSEVIEHLDDRKIAFQHLTKMMTPGGTLVVTAPTGYLYATEKIWGHTTHPTVKELEQHALHNNLSLVQCSNWGFPTYAALKYVTNINPEWSVKHFAAKQMGLLAKMISTILYYVNYLNLPHSSYGCQLFAVFSKPAHS